MHYSYININICVSFIDSVFTWNWCHNNQSSRSPHLSLLHFGLPVARQHRGADPGTVRRDPCGPRRGGGGGAWDGGVHAPPHVPPDPRWGGLSRLRHHRPRPPPCDPCSPLRRHLRCVERGILLSTRVNFGGKTRTARGEGLVCLCCPPVVTPSFFFAWNVSVPLFGFWME